MRRYVIAKGTEGTTLVDVCVGAALLGLITITSLDAIERIGKLNAYNKDERRAIAAAQAKLAHLRTASPFGKLARWLKVGDAAYVSSLATFTVPDLPSRQSGGPAGLLEAFADEANVPVELGGPLELNGNSTTTDTRLTEDYRILPVRVTVTWGGTDRYRDSSITLYTILYEGDPR